MSPILVPHGILRWNSWVAVIDVIGRNFISGLTQIYCIGNSFKEMSDFKVLSFIRTWYIIFQNVAVIPLEGFPWLFVLDLEKKPNY